ncbi:bifunctional riboflavin kinase/FAD synthetase [Flavobacteriaceae bacterium]|mgnify:FL=1|nr:riboflavin biosynthesis protein RibF [Flavobacteriaceae bacterium]MCP4803386.1 bifunctional riboflavin kinase/FAD synthetase [Bacteroidota bacterium]MDA9551717.1 bifunctional riboflavin kinase/FAD synthetase [Flavobacteriaceae bacterium]MDB2472096.1 bifunctional riboflavin kinase/FAD synthetase [Flavobacteriaceae bacterium]MDB2612244.1 bifunctional riboflavin kinase/FAD synthetase [Flavobacteriaceae bacterium]
MKIKAASDYKLLSNSVVTIGTFDGVHIGHKKIINRLVNIAKQEGLQAVVLTFFPHPRMVVQSDTKIKMLNTIDEKNKLLEQQGIDHLVIKKFTKDFSRLSAQEYVRKVLVETLHVKHIIIGYDHHFGRNRTANIHDLKAFGEIYDFKVTEILAQEIDEVTISSTKIRQALNSGDVKTANTFLGYNFMISGTVVKGKGIGKTLNFPTANIRISESYKLIPKHGVYVVKTRILNTTVFGMMNIGVNPTVNGKLRSIEIHFFDFSQDIYGVYLEIEILKRLREEQKFDSLAELEKQLLKDAVVSKQFLQQING